MGVRVAQGDVCMDAPMFGLAQEGLCAPVSTFEFDLRCGDSSVCFKVKLADPNWWRRVLGGGLVEEAFRRREFDAGLSLQVTETVRGCEHLTCWPASSVTPPERQQGHAASALVPKLSFGSM